MIIDMTLFFAEHEFDLYELRLRELDPVVDLFVVGESLETFSGDHKGYHFEQSGMRYQPWERKIRYVQLGQFLPGNAWYREFAHRDLLWTATQQWVHEDDWVISSDLDEIPSRRAIEQLHTSPTILQQRLFYYGIDLEMPIPWWGPTAWTVEMARWVSGQYLRLGGLREGPRRGPVEIDHSGGWHFSWLGGWEAAKKKVDAFPECAQWGSDPDRFVKSRMKEGLDIIGDTRLQVVPIDDTYPDWIREAPEIWEQYRWKP